MIYKKDILNKPSEMNIQILPCDTKIKKLLDHRIWQVYSKD